MPRSLSKNVARIERGERKRSKQQPLRWLRHVNVAHFLEAFDIANITQSTADELFFSCPFPDHARGDTIPSARMNTGAKDPDKTTLWTCYGCKRGGNAVTFLAEYNNISKQEARRQIKENYAPGYSAPKHGSIAKEFDQRMSAVKEREPSTTVQTIDTEIIRNFDVDWGHYAEEYGDYPDVSYMLDRGFTPATLDEWGIGYDARSERITIPVCNEDGDLVGFRGRAWRKETRPKYLVLGDKGRRRYGFPTYDKARVVFGLDRHTSSNSQSLVLVEGEIDVMSLDVMGIAAISCCGSSMSTEQARLIREYCDEVVLFFDDDAAGRNGIYGVDKGDGEHKPGIIELLEPFIRVRVVGRHRFDANDYLRRGATQRVHELVDGAVSSFLL
jgi:hypothetical protein